MTSASNHELDSGCTDIYSHCRSGKHEVFSSPLRKDVQCVYGMYGVYVVYPCGACVLASCFLLRYTNPRFMSPQYTLPVPITSPAQTFTVCPLSVHCLLTVYSLPIHCLFTAYSLPIHCCCLLSTPIRYPHFQHVPGCTPLPFHCLFIASLWHLFAVLSLLPLYYCFSVRDCLSDFKTDEGSG